MMIDLHYLRHVSRSTSRIIARGWLYRFYVIFILLATAVAMVVRESSVLGMFQNTAPWIASTVFFWVAMVCTAYQAIPVALQAGRIFHKDLKLDSMDVIFIRPQSNGEYVGGICLAFFRVIMRVLVIAGGITLLINGLLSEQPVALWAYLFYGIALPVPALLFFIGWSLLVVRWIPNRALNICVLLGTIFAAMIYASGPVYGVLDPFGQTLPNFFSEMTGHPDLPAFLLQRLGWLLLGTGLIGWAVFSFRRLPNRSQSTSVGCLVSGVLVVAALLSLYGSYCRYRVPDRNRVQYADAYNRYADREHLTVRSQTIDYRQENNRMQVTVRIEAEHGGTQPLSEGIFYLNPYLEITSLREADREVPFERDRQVVRLLRVIRPGEVLKLEMTYAGTIDPSVCYLDIHDKGVFSDNAPQINGVYTGRNYHFLQKNYTLLIPECLWYPVAEAPVHPKSTFDVRKDFTRYTLRVANPQGRSVISQGERVREGDTDCFTNLQPLTGITLCIGAYTTRSLTVDSVTYEVCLFDKHLHLLDSMQSLTDTLPSLLPFLMAGESDKMGRDYPFRALRLIEVPASFVSYHRREHGGSECVQPEMILLPESGIGLMASNFTRQRELYKLPVYQHMLNMADDMQTPLALSMRVFNTFLQNIQNEYMGFRGGSKDVSLPGITLSFNWEGGYRINNPFYPASLFYQHVNAVVSSDCPVMNAALVYMQQARAQRYFDTDNLGLAGKSTYLKALNYLDGHSLRGALSDPEVDPRLADMILRMKSLHLRNEITASGPAPTEIAASIAGYLSAHPFRVIPLDELARTVNEQLEIDLESLLASWYTVDSLPRLIVRNVIIGETVSLPEMESPAYRLRADVYNNSDTEGIVSLVAGGNSIPSISPQLMRGVPRELLRQFEGVFSFRIPPRQGYRLVALTEHRPQEVQLVTNVAANRPAVLHASRLRNTPVSDTARGMIPLPAEEFFPGAGEWIVDNEDAGFRRVSNRAPDTRFRQYLRRWGRSGEKVYIEQSRALGMPRQWTPIISSDYYGNHLLSGEVKMAGKSDDRLEWSVRLPHGGLYRIEVYLPAVTRSITGTQSERDLLQQTYLITTEESLREESVRATRTGWVSLGEFHLGAGEQTVTLFDRGMEGQYLYGDAVKWVYLGEK